jgi:hypothetical protein
MSAFDPLQTLAQPLPIGVLNGVTEDTMSWLWPRGLNEDATLTVRIGRLVHWSFVGLAVLFATVSVVAGLQQQVAEAVFYVTVIGVWFAFAMLGRGLRYLLARE